MQVANPQALLQKVLREVLGHLLRQRGDEHAITLRHPLLHVHDDVVDLTLRRLYDDFRVDQTGWPHHLLDDLHGVRLLELGRSRRHENALIHSLERLFESQWPVLARAR